MSRYSVDPFKRSTTSLSSTDSDTAGGMDVVKKTGLSLARKAKHHHQHPHQQEDPKHSSLALKLFVESPPLVSYGAPEQSTGALFSGQIELTVYDELVEIESFDVTVESVTEFKKPVSSHCKECATKVEELTKFSLIPEGHSSLKLARGKHSFPASYLFAGYLPTTCRTSLCSIIYRLTAIAVPKPSLVPPPSKARSPTSSPTLQPSLRPVPATLSHELHLSRAILPTATNSHLSVRVFPPTALTARITHPTIIYPIGSIPISLTLTKISTLTNPLRAPASSLVPTVPIHLRWRLRKFFWRLEQTVRSTSPPCPKPEHLAKVGGPANGLQHDTVTILSKGEVSTGWKSDFTPDTGTIDWEGEFPLSPAHLPRDPHPHKDTITCTNASPAGLQITHRLILEMIVAEEWATAKRPNHPTPTGAARILRTSVDVKVTERAGLGVSWDEEAPPIYQDVPASPPGRWKQRSRRR
ncbi:hypothetical protein P152DRAFT_195533 [Eremomyces bilateralis CBS 781.70]|uniref:LDB19 N-terminal domain-containing protein n=1 Tax=Eremomyces bilateralis CBS 781.70 TaxID=1392243 RepID=A0A6G1GCL6_9PEZI|nr:uncharacterized protein P152DRAFT_195533 [Eremomyces bilateralis CBS 781.70]KAF1815742.1 hypothetical protein P152DRAFT_195533 [Eremomyces bilateralis CBS 781.70]